MKKFMAVMLAVMMLVALVTVAPAYAEEEAINLLINGDFEAEGDQLGSTEFTGWTNTNPENPFTLVQNGTGKSAKALNDSNGEQSGTDMPETSMYQEVQIDTNAEWYTDSMSWIYELSFDGYNASRTPGVKARVTITNADGESSVQDYDPIDDGGGYWAWTKRTFSLEKQVRNMSNTAVKAIKVELFSGIGRWNYTNLDNIAITPVYAPLNENSYFGNLIVNGDFEAKDDEIDSTEITGWTNLNPENEFTLIEYKGGKAIKALNDSNADQSGTDMSDALLEQTVTINTNSMWYESYQDWTFKLSADGYNAGRVPLASFVVTINFTSGQSNEKEYTAIDDGTGYWAWSNRSYDLTEQVRAYSKPIESITVKINSRMRWYYSAFDNIVLTPVYSPVEKGLLTNGSFENLNEEGTLTEWEFLNTLQFSALVTEDAEGSHNGENYLVFTSIENEVAMLRYNATPGTTYVFEVYYKSDKANAAKLQVYDQWERKASANDRISAAAENWTPVRIITTVPAHAVDPVIRFQIGNLDPEATVMFDSAVLYEMDRDYNNVFLNNTFEYDTAKSAEGEYITNIGGGNGFKLVTDYAHSGKNAVAARQGNNVVTYAVLYDRDDASMAKSEVYNFNFWVNDNIDRTNPENEAARKPSLRFLFYKIVPDGSMSSKGDAFTYEINPAVQNEWQFESVQVPVPASCDYVRIDFFSGAGWTRFDDVTFERVQTGIKFEDAEGNKLEELAEETQSLKVSALYVGDADTPAGKLYIAQYEKDSVGDLRLVGINVAPIAATGAPVNKELTELAVTKDSTVIKAFIWDANLGAVCVNSIE